MLPDGAGGLYLVSASAVLHRDARGEVTDHAQAGSASGAVALGDDGSLYLGQSGRVLRVAADGTTTVFVQDVGEVYGLALDIEGRLFVADWSGGRVVVVERGATRVLASGLAYPSGLVPDGKGNLHVKESGRQTGEPMRITRINPDGTTSVFATLRRDAPVDPRLRTATFALG